MAERIPFSRASLRALRRPRAGWAYRYDQAVRGLAIGVSHTGARSFLVYRKFQGRPTRITLGAFDPDLPETRELPHGSEPLDLLGNKPALNVRMARKMATAVNAQLDAGVDPSRAVRQARQEMTLGQLFALYAADRERNSKKTVPKLVWAFERYLGELPEAPRKKHAQERSKPDGAVNWQRRPLSSISYQDVSRLRLDLREKVGPTTANRVMEVLHATYNFGKNQRLYEGENPAAGLRKFPLLSRERFLQPYEARQFFKALALEADADFKDYVALSIFSGARRGNVLAMRWDELNLEDGQWSVSGEKTKNGEPLVLPLVDEAVQVLRRRSNRAGTDGWVFPGNGSGGHMGPPRRQWARVIKQAGISDLRIHDLRRSLGSWMANTGASVVMTQRALGHKTIDASLVYQRLQLEPVRAAMQKAVAGLLQAAQDTEVATRKGRGLRQREHSRTRKLTIAS